MYEIKVTGETIPEAYHKALAALDSCGEEVECPAWNTTCWEAVLNMEIKRPLQEPMISRFFPGGFRELEQYRLEMLDGILDWAVCEIGYDGHYLEPYTYHDRMGFQLKSVIDELKRDRNSRRAVISIGRPYDLTNELTDDLPCLQSIQYLVRDGMLYTFILFRSNDATEATFMNAFALALLSKKVADALDVPVGTMFYRVNSFHVYAKEQQKLMDFVDRYRNTSPFHRNEELCYSYDGEWKELMDAETESIKAEMEKLERKYLDALEEG